MRRSRHLLVLISPLLLTGLALTGCGLRGDLKTPPPVWGEDLRSPEEIKANAPTQPDEAIQNEQTPTGSDQ